MRVYQVECRVLQRDISVIHVSGLHDICVQFLVFMQSIAAQRVIVPIAREWLFAFANSLLVKYLRGEVTSWT